MKKTLIGFVALLTLVGCDDFYTPPAVTFFPTNHWRVTSVIEGEVVVEALGTNLPARFRVVKALPMSPLTNGQPVRVELTTQLKPGYGGSAIQVISAKAYPSTD